jgi:hypothetical protein
LKVSLKDRLQDELECTPTAARASLADAEFRRDRLQAALAALPWLKTTHRKTYQAEQYALWRASFDTVAAKQTELAQELEQLCQPFEDKIIGLLLRIEQADNEAVGI